MSACCLCSNLVSDQSKDFWNESLFESTNFSVLPSLGSLVQGWLMIVPKEHLLCFGALSPQIAAELEAVKNRVGELLRRQYGNVCAFEHGPSRTRRQVGCGVDHAHLHMVPLNFDLREAASRFLPPESKWFPGSLKSCQAAYGLGQDYLYIEQPLGQGQITVHRDFGSQTLRRAIAARVGLSEQFNWREYPQMDVISRTITVWNLAVSV